MTNASASLIKTNSAITSTPLVLEALLELAAFDAVASLRQFRTLKWWAIRKARRVMNGAEALDRAKEIAVAIDAACTIYPKTAMCLQRSVVLTRMCRRRGCEVELVTGIQRLPFRSHAWVELDGIPIGDSKKVQEVYVTLDRWKINR